MTNSSQRLTEGYCSPRARSQQCGFTLIEVLLVLILLVAMLSVAWPTLSSMGERQIVEQAALSLLRTIHQSRDRALREQRSIVISVAPDGRTILIDHGSTRDEGVMRLDESVQVRSSTEGSTSVVCHRNGRITTDRLEVVDQHNRGITINCHPLTGILTLTRNGDSGP